MAQLDLYNGALLLLGQRQLASLTEDREPRYRLDGAYNREAIKFCVELVKPNFASKVVTLNSPGAGNTFDFVHTLPADYTSTIAVFSDPKLDQPVNRYLIEGRTILTDYQTIYLRYIYGSPPISIWDASFSRVMEGYLALQTCTRLAPKEYDKVVAEFNFRVTAAQSINAAQEPAARSTGPSVTLTTPWRHIYNDALLIMGLEEITTNDDDSAPRVRLDRTLDADLVKDLLEDTGWHFGISTIKSFYDPSLNPDWGYKYAHVTPPKMHRMDGVFMDEFQLVPVKNYNHEGNHIFCEHTEIWVKYVSQDFMTNPSNWPTYFKRLVAGRMAKDAAPSLVRSHGADVENARTVYDERRSSGMSTDAMVSPPRKIAQGNWTKSRRSGYGNYRGRP
jgi:hypothetical protein